MTDTALSTIRLLGGPLDGELVEDAQLEISHFTVRSPKPVYFARYEERGMNRACEREFLCVALSKEIPE